VIKSIYNPPHPGSIVKEALESIPISVSEFAAYIGVARGTLSRLLNERAGITPEMSIKITQAFGLPSSDLLFRLQNKYDFWQAAHRVKRRKIATLKQIRMAKAA
jgi:addiction module HigA family antidote